MYTLYCLYYTCILLTLYCYTRIRYCSSSASQKCMQAIIATLLFSIPMQQDTPDTHRSTSKLPSISNQMDDLLLL